MGILCTKKMLCLAAAALLGICCLAGPAVAQGPGSGRRSHMTMNPEGEAPAAVPAVKATIVKKDLKTVTASTGAVYTLFEETIIVGADGKQLSIRKMPVPCSAELVYTTEKGLRKVMRIGITAVSENATTIWTDKDPG